MPIFTAAGAVLMLRERVAPRQMVGLLVGLAGVAIVVSNEIAFGNAQWIGYAATLVALAESLSATFIKRSFAPAWTCAPMALCN